LQTVALCTGATVHYSEGALIRTVPWCGLGIGLGIQKTVHRPDVTSRAVGLSLKKISGENSKLL